MDANIFHNRWNTLLRLHRELQSDPFLRPLQEDYLSSGVILTYQHTDASGWAIALLAEGVMVKAFDDNETVSLDDVHPEFDLPTWAADIYQADAWHRTRTTTFKYNVAGETQWMEPWLAHAWWPIDAQHLLDPTDDAVRYWANWFGRDDLAAMWCTAITDVTCSTKE